MTNSTTALVTTGQPGLHRTGYIKSGVLVEIFLDYLHYSPQKHSHHKHSRAPYFPTKSAPTVSSYLFCWPTFNLKDPKENNLLVFSSKGLHHSIQPLSKNHYQVCPKSTKMCLWVTSESWTSCGCATQRMDQKPTCGCSKIIDQGTQRWHGYCNRPNCSNPPKAK